MSKAGKYSIVHENIPVPGCTISGEILPGVVCFSLAKWADISAESYPMDVLVYQLWGAALFKEAEDSLERIAGPGDILRKQAGRNIGVQAIEDCIYLELQRVEGKDMNEVLKAGEVFQLKDLVPYQNGKIVNMDIAANDKMKFVVMSFDERTGLTEHAAPGDAIVFALDGNGVIGYEGKEYPIKAGEQFRFAKGGMHSVKANGKFKMALLLTLA